MDPYLRRETGLDRHCERSEAIQSGARGSGLLRRSASRNDETVIGFRVMTIRYFKTSGII